MKAPRKTGYYWLCLESGQMDIVQVYRDKEHAPGLFYEHFNEREILRVSDVPESARWFKVRDPSKREMAMAFPDRMSSRAILKPS